MPDSVHPVDAERHSAVRIKPITAEYLAGLHLASLSMIEIADMGANCPVVFLRDQGTGHYRLACLMGFAAGENLFVQEGAWGATHLPAALATAPFLITELADGSLGPGLDEASELVSNLEGELLYENGVETPFLEARKRDLERLLEAEIETHRFTNLVAYGNLLKAMQLEVSFESGSTRKLAGLYTVDVAALRRLQADKLEELNVSGQLAALHMMQASLAQMKRLVNLKNARGGEKIAALDVQAVEA